MRVPEEILSWMFTFILLVTLVVFGTWMYKDDSSTNFNQQVHTVIQDNGGLTPNAQQLIHQISETNYHNQFQVVTDDGNNTGNVTPYGQPITYQIQANVSLNHEKMTHFTQHWQTTSLVRPNSQD